MSEIVEIYVSTDVETDGPIPGPYSMLSFGSAAFSADGTLLATFTANLKTLPDASTHPKNMAFWADNPEAWEICRKDQQDPERAILKYAAWLNSLPGKPVFVAYPLGFDFTFIYWYLTRFADESPFGYNGIDIRTYAMAVLKRTYDDSKKGKMPVEWFDTTLPHTHNALDDAKEQGALFFKMLAHNASIE